MAVVSLLGDSIIDNKIYVKQNEFSVKEHLEQNSNHLYTQLAVDGHTTKDVLQFQLNSLLILPLIKLSRWVAMIC